jgi:hypothetical protein
MPTVTHCTELSSNTEKTNNQSFLGCNIMYLASCILEEHVAFTFHPEDEGIRSI